MQIKILSWNIWFDGNMDGICDFLRSSKADIICLQEVCPEDKTRDVIGFLDGLGYAHVCSTVRDVPSAGKRICHAIFSKHQIQSTNRRALSEERSREALEATVNVGNASLHIFTVHFPHTHQLPSDVQNEQAKNLMKLLPKEKTLVMGDFNATPESEVIRRLGEVLVDTDPSSQPTWSVYPQGCPVCLRPTVDTRLDYIFATRDIKWNSFEVGGSKASDHLPISILVDI